MPYPLPPPPDETTLMARARAMAGHSLCELARLHGVAVPPDLKREKGWVGQFMEGCLGASAASLAEPDFPQLGVELKTLPIDRDGRPRESTYVCTVPLEGGCGESWQQCWLRRKLARVLWLPVEAAPELPLAQRRIGAALLWSPDAQEERLLRQDWEELMDMVCMGEVERIRAAHGQVLQIRPKAAHSRVRCTATGEDGARIRTNPRGFYLRAGFTHALLQRHFSAPA